MHELQDGLEDVGENAQRIHPRLAARVVKRGLAKFDIPIAELRPDKIVKFARGKPELIFFQVFRDVFDDVVEAAKYPLVRMRQTERAHFFELDPFAVHQKEPRRVPDLVHEVARALRLFVHIAHIAAGSDALNE